MKRPPLALVEPHADRRNGHPSRTLLALAQAHGNAHVIVPPSTAPGLFNDLQQANAHVVTRAIGRRSRLLAVVGHAVNGAGVSTGRIVRSKRWPDRLRRVPHQVTLLGRCLEEAAAVRTAHRLRPGTAVVVLTAAPGLHRLVGRLGGRHLRFVHEITTTEDLPLRLVGRLARSGEARVTALAPTVSVQRQLRDRFPTLAVRVRPFATASPSERVTPDERAESRARHQLTETDRTVALVGGWWPEKDIPTVSRALERVQRPLHLLVTGHPLDRGVLDLWGRLPGVRLHLLPGPADDAAVRALYAAGDAVLVARHDGVRKESGLVVDAVRLGLPLICSAHDPDLTARLDGTDWARSFPVGDADHLASLLDQFEPSTGARDTSAFGVPTPQAQVAFLTTQLPGRPT